MRTLVIGIALLWAAAARAQAPAPAGTSGEAKAPEVDVKKGPGGKKTYVIKTEFVIEGRIQKPNAFYVLQRSSINYEWASLKQDFLPRIVDSVGKSPF